MGSATSIFQNSQLILRREEHRGVQESIATTESLATDNIEDSITGTLEDLPNEADESESSGIQQQSNYVINLDYKSAEQRNTPVQGENLCFLHQLKRIYGSKDSLILDDTTVSISSENTYDTARSTPRQLIDAESLENQMSNALHQHSQISANELEYEHTCDTFSNTFNDLHSLYGSVAHLNIAECSWNISGRSQTEAKSMPLDLGDCDPVEDNQNDLQEIETCAGTLPSTSKTNLKDSTSETEPKQVRSKSKRGSRAVGSLCKRGLKVCEFCEKGEKEHRVTRNNKNSKRTHHMVLERKAMKRKFKVPKTTQTILKHTLDDTFPKANPYHNFLKYYKRRVGIDNYCEMSAINIWNTMSPIERQPFCLLAKKKQRIRYGKYFLPKKRL